MVFETQQILHILKQLATPDNPLIDSIQLFMDANNDLVAQIHDEKDPGSVESFQMVDFDGYVTIPVGNQAIDLISSHFFKSTPDQNAEWTTASVRQGWLVWLHVDNSDGDTITFGSGFTDVDAISGAGIQNKLLYYDGSTWREIGAFPALPETQIYRGNASNLAEATDIVKINDNGAEVTVDHPLTSLGRVVNVIPLESSDPLPSVYDHPIGTLAVKTGFTGFIGQTGATGVGAVGSTGATGVATTGATGVGTTGATGIGTTGATGIATTGATGATGVSTTGAIGATGVSTTGAVGATGIGITGATGVGTTGATGVSTTGAVGATGVGTTGATGVSTTGAVGATGVGTTGATGVSTTGAVGATGIGITGAVGATGIGITGATGVSTTGAVGATGVSTTGAVGATGIGITGATGVSTTGPTGATGVSTTGPTGATGVGVSGSPSSGNAVYWNAANGQLQYSGMIDLEGIQVDFNNVVDFNDNANFNNYVDFNKDVDFNEDADFNKDVGFFGILDCYDGTFVPRYDSQSTTPTLAEEEFSIWRNSSNGNYYLLYRSPNDGNVYKVQMTT